MRICNEPDSARTCLLHVNRQWGERQNENEREREREKALYLESEQLNREGERSGVETEGKTRDGNVREAERKTSICIFSHVILSINVTFSAAARCVLTYLSIYLSLGIVKSRNLWSLI
jgi:hypothetical protein